MYPTFIIANTGQSNSQGFGGIYLDNNPDDQPDKRILGWNPVSNNWEIADLRSESLGYKEYRSLNNQLFVFHTAKAYVKENPNEIVGIINYGIGGQTIALWVKYDEIDQYYNTNFERAIAWGSTYGSIYDAHVSMISNALQSHPYKSNIDLICWHQGEADGQVEYGYEENYFKESLLKVIQQYRKESFANYNTPFICGETIKNYNEMNWSHRNEQLLKLNYDCDFYTKCVYSNDLPTDNFDSNGKHDGIHFNSIGHKILGRRYYNAYKSIFYEFSDYENYIKQNCKLNRITISDIEIDQSKKILKLKINKSVDSSWYVKLTNSSESELYHHATLPRTTDTYTINAEYGVWNLSVCIFNDLYELISIDSSRVEIIHVLSFESVDVIENPDPQINIIINNNLQEYELHLNDVPIYIGNDINYNINNLNYGEVNLKLYKNGLLQDEYTRYIAPLSKYNIKLFTDAGSITTKTIMHPDPLECNSIEDALVKSYNDSESTGFVYDPDNNIAWIFKDEDTPELTKFNINRIYCKKSNINMIIAPFTDILYGDLESAIYSTNHEEIYNNLNTNNIGVYSTDSGLTMTWFLNNVKNTITKQNRTLVIYNEQRNFQYWFSLIMNTKLEKENINKIGNFDYNGYYPLFIDRDEADRNSPTNMSHSIQIDDFGLIYYYSDSVYFYNGNYDIINIENEVANKITQPNIITERFDNTMYKLSSEADDSNTDIVPFYKISSQSHDVLLTRIIFSPDEKIMFVCSLNGILSCAMINDTNEYMFQKQSIINVNTNYFGEGGLLSVILSDTFNINSLNVIDKYAFLLYQDGDLNQMLILRLTLQITDDIVSYQNFKVIYNFDKSASAHQIMDGYCFDEKLYFLMGDCFKEEDAQDISTDAGKIISINFDGSDKCINAKGVRNEYSMKKLSHTIDPLERTIAVGNGHSLGRLWLAPIPSHDEIKSNTKNILNLGWGADGDDNIEEDKQGWQSFVYSIGDPILFPNGVLELFPGDPSANGLDVFIHNGETNVIISTFGKTATQTSGANLEKKILQGKLTNFGNQPSLLDLKPIVERTNNEGYSSPVDCTYNKSQSRIYFIDIYSSSIYFVQL